MKKKLFSLLALGALLVSCGKTPSSEDPSLPSSEKDSETPSEKVSETPSETSSEPVSEEPPLVVDDPEPTPTYADETPTISRAYNELFDTMLDDFSGDEPLGTPSGAAAYLSHPYLLAHVHNKGVAAADKRGNSPDSSVYKAASGVYQIHDYDIRFKLRLVAGSLSLDDIYLGLRGDDAWKVYSIPFSELYDDNLSELPKLTEELQTYTISLNNSLFDDTVTYELAAGGDSGQRVLQKVLGIHLFVGDEVDAKIGLEEVSLVKAGLVTMFDNFDREKVNAADPNLWWRDSIGKIVPRHVELKDGGAYQVESAEAAAGKENLVVSLRGEFSGLSLVPVVEGVAGDAIAWKNLLDPEGEALIASTHDYKSVVINLAKSGLLTGATGFKLVATSRVFVKGLFFSNLETKEATKQWPYVDIAHGVVFDDFEGRTQGNFAGDYDAAIADQNTIDAGLLYILSYHNGNLAKIENGLLTFDATSLAQDDYINLKMAATPKQANSGQKYLVLAVKGEDGAKLDGLRVAGTAPTPTYFGEWKSAFGLPVPNLDNLGKYPYVDGEGFAYLVVDLEETGFAFADVIDFYYSGVGKLHIDAIIFADVPTPANVAGGSPVGDAENEVMLGEGYKYTYGGNVGEAPYYAVTFIGDGTVDLSSVRIAGSVDVAWFKDGVVIDQFGEPITDLTLKADEPRQLVIDLVASGIGGGDLHIHAGDMGEAAGKLIIGEKLAVEVSVYTRVINSELHEVTITEGYNYGFGLDYADPGRYLVIEVTGDGAAGLGTMRIETAGATIWAPSLILASVEALGDYKPVAEGSVIVIDLIASGYNFFALGGEMHFHFSGEGASVGTVTITSVAFRDNAPASYAGLLPIA